MSTATWDITYTSTATSTTTDWIETTDLDWGGAVLADRHRGHYHDDSYSIEYDAKKKKFIVSRGWDFEDR